MVYTVTFNPSLDYVISVDDFRMGMTNRTSSELLLSGGKGINVSTVLTNLGVENTALGFVAGFTGDEIVRRLNEAGVKTDFIHMDAGVSRINIKLLSVEGTEINGNGPKIGRDQIEWLMAQLNAMKTGDVLFLSGSIPESIPDDIYEKIMAAMDGKGILIIVDAAGDLLLKVLKYHPFLIKPNHHELGDIFGQSLKDRRSSIPFGRRLQEMGARNVLVSLAGKGAVLIAENGQVFESAAPKGHLVNGVGAGDSMAAGFMAGWMERRDYRHAFYMGLAAGSASAFSEHLATGEEIENIYRKIMDNECRENVK